MENKVDYTISRQHIEQVFKTNLTDEQWLALASELENLIDFHAWYEIEHNLLPQIDWLVEQDQEYN